MTDPQQLAKELSKSCKSILYKVGPQIQPVNLNSYAVYSKNINIDNDGLMFYIIQKGNTFTITDDSYNIWLWLISGFPNKTIIETLESVHNPSHIQFDKENIYKTNIKRENLVHEIINFNSYLTNVVKALVAKG